MSARRKCRGGPPWPPVVLNLSRVQISDAGPTSRQNPARKLLNYRVSGTQDAALDLLTTLHLLCPETARACVEVVEFTLQDTPSIQQLPQPQ